MADRNSGRRVVAAAVAMILASQLLAIATDLVRRQRDPSDVVGLALLIVLSVFLLRRARWARWVMAALAAAGGLLEAAAVILLIATATIPGFWSLADSAIPALAGLRVPVIQLAAGHSIWPVAISLLASGLLDLFAAGLLMFAPSGRAYFAPASARG